MNFDLFWLLKSLPAVVIGLTVHELAHALMAYFLGDMTAKNDGRLTLNPLKHIDPLGFILIVIAGFGWAKPVNFNPANLRNKHRDEILISLAGPFSNFLLARLIGPVFDKIASTMVEAFTQRAHAIYGKP